MVYLSLPTALPSSTISTNKIILDYLLYLSIRSRLIQQQQRQQSSHRLSSSQSRNDKQNKAVESMVTGILSSHCNKNHRHKLDLHFGQRLHLCQLTALLFARYDTTARLYDSPSSIIPKSPDALPYHCRKHRQLTCTYCLSPTQPSSALIQAIPFFLKTTAHLLRQTLDKQQKDKTPMMVDGEKVMGGGLPKAWYTLFLDLMTQAVIEAYVCDGQVGMEPIVSVFSYGYVEDEEEDDADYQDSDDEDDDTFCTADHHLLFPKTRTMFLFKTQVWEREQEFLSRQDGLGIQDHFERLAVKYPVEPFDQAMRDFIQMVLDTMDLPALAKEEDPFLSLDGGSLFMPENPDDPPSSLVSPTTTFKKQKI